MSHLCKTAPSGGVSELCSCERGQNHICELYGVPLLDAERDCTKCGGRGWLANPTTGAINVLCDECELARQDADLADLAHGLHAEDDAARLQALESTRDEAYGDQDRDGAWSL